ncbi:MAG: hypothetical protein HKN36_11715 [Hellea sp.]|nr:hypothetical protein [Hellea sp.]
MKHRKLLVAALAVPALLSSTSAYAHTGDHGEHIVANIIHWLSSPAHSLFAVIAGAAFVALAYRALRKSRT